MTDKLKAAAEMALKAMQDIIHWYSERDENDEVLHPYNQTPEVLEAIQAVEALRQALAEPKREWVGLTEEEIFEDEWWDEETAYNVNKMLMERNL